MPIHDSIGHGKRRAGFLRDRSDSTGQPRADFWRQGLLDFVQLDVDASVAWTSIGPGPLYIDTVGDDRVFQGKGPDSGEVTDIAIDPSGDADTNIFIATNDGGIWKSTDGGASWLPTMDLMPSLSMGAVTIDPTNPQVVYAGSGNPFDGGSEFTKGVGIFRSSDGGATWAIVDGGPLDTVFAGRLINRIVVPASDTVLVATNDGLYRSTDGGQKFTNVLDGFITCLLPGTARPKETIYAGVYGVGVMKSTDGGRTFRNLFHNPGSPTSLPFGNLELAQSESNPRILLVSMQYTPPDSDPVYRGVFRSTDGGAHWHPRPLSTVDPAAEDDFGQSDYDLTLGIDPQKSSLVYAGFQELWKSTDGGRTFRKKASTAGYVHWDHHALAFSPRGHRKRGRPTTIYVGTDGGIARSTNGGATWKAINGSIASNLFLGIDIGKGAGNAYTYGGCQDTGTSARRPRDAGSTHWHQGIDGDGYLVAVDPADPRIVYGFDNALFIKSVNAGKTFLDNSDPESARVGKNLPQFDDPPSRAIALEQNNPDPKRRVVYVAFSHDLYKSTDGGASFGPSILSTQNSIISLATSTANSRLIWAGTAASSFPDPNSGGSVYVSNDGGDTWNTEVTNLPGTGSITGIAIDPADPSRVAVVYGGQSGIDATFRTGRMYLTTDGGATWNDVSGTDGKGPIGNLPDLPMHSVVFDTSVTPSALVVACDAGVMRCTGVKVSRRAVSATWKIYGAGLPNVSCSSLAIDNTVQPPVLRVGTYGRGCFELTRSAGPALSIESLLGFGFVPVGRSVSLPVYVYNCGDAPLVVTAISRSAGSADFTVDPAPAFPVTVAPGATANFGIVFTPSARGDQSAAFDLVSNDPASPCRMPASGCGVRAGAPRLATNPSGEASFGSVILPGSRSILLQMFNTGTSDLRVSKIEVSRGSHLRVHRRAYPIRIAPGGEAQVKLTYSPSKSGDTRAEVVIRSNDARGARRIVVSGRGVRRQRRRP